MATTTARPRTRWGVAVLAIALVIAGVLALDGTAPPADTSPEPATMEHIDGTELNRITLTAQAATRLDLQTTTVERDGGNLVIPGGAVIVDPDGTTWAYEAVEPLVFVRTEIVVASEADGSATLSEGPAEGTTIVSVGAAELYGVEHGIGH